MQSKALICLIAAGVLLLPAGAHAAEKKEIHTVTTSEEMRAADTGRISAKGVAKESSDDNASAAGETSAAEEKPAPDKDAALAEEMDELGGTREEGAAAQKEPPIEDTKEPPAEDAAQENPNTQTPEGEKTGTGVGDSVDVYEALGVFTSRGREIPETAPGDGLGSADEDELYGDETAIDPISLTDGDWVFVEGDERRGWFVDRSRMHRNADGTLSYWQLILYNEFGRAQFADAMQDKDYKSLCYTLQRRVLDIKKNTVRTYEIIAIGTGGKVLADSTRTGEPADIHTGTMAEHERDTVKKLARSIKKDK